MVYNQKGRPRCKKTVKVIYDIIDRSIKSRRCRIVSRALTIDHINIHNLKLALRTVFICLTAFYGIESITSLVHSCL